MMPRPHPVILPRSWRAEILTPVESLQRELKYLRALAEQILSHRREIVAQWRDLYCVGGLVGTLKKDDFFHFLADAIARNKDDLIRSDLNSYVSDVRALGRLLFNKKVSMADAATLNHLFQGSVLRVLPSALTRGDGCRALETLGLVRGSLISESYSSWQLGHFVDPAKHDEARCPSERLADPRVPGLVGKGPAMRRLTNQILGVAARGTTVLVEGETGTGKELAARAIHECGPHAGGPFVAVNCAAISRDLIESELFGHRKGAFSGADNDYPGLFRAASGGTLFLDEISEMAPEFQSKLLRAIQERAVRQVGSSHEQPVAVRIIASTNREPEEAIRAGQLRRDLYYRLQATVVRVPPLREHPEDIPLLVEHFIALVARTVSPAAPVIGIEPEALGALMRYAWPGNIRQLANVIEAGCTFGRSAAICCNDLPAAIATRNLAENEDLTLAVAGVTSLHGAEEHLIRLALMATRGNKARAAVRLQISRKTLYAKITKYGLRDF